MREMEDWGRGRWRTGEEGKEIEDWGRGEGDGGLGKREVEDWGRGRWRTGEEGGGGLGKRIWRTGEEGCSHIRVQFIQLKALQL